MKAIDTSRRTLVIVCTLSLAVAACGTDDTTTAPAPASFTAEVSQCGGFESSAAGGSYCSAERVLWSYDAAKRTLTVEDRRVALNCCGQRSIDVTRASDGLIVVREKDVPEAGGARCRCSCTYDFRVTLRDVAPGSPKLRIERTVSDNTAQTRTVFDQAINLADASGDVVVDSSDAAPWCTPPASSPFANPRVSECGGFVANQRSKADNGGAGAAGSYCDAEVLEWSFDAGSGVLSLSNNRVLLNCCGKHDVSVRKEGARYVIGETDAPLDGARCNCMCVFDFAVDIKNVAGGRLEIALERTITDNDGTKPIYSGALDLSAGRGQLVLDSTDIGPWCEKH